MSTYQFLTLSIDNHVATVTLNRPEVRNAFNEVLISELTRVFLEISSNADVRVVVLAAQSPSFCAGADLNWMKQMASYSFDENYQDAMGLAIMLNTIYDTPVPVIARVHGDAYAGGMGLVSVCDIVVASENVNFCLSEAKLGLLPATIAPYVVMAMGRQAARRYFVTAEKFTARQAQAMGLVHELCESDRLDETIDAMTSQIVANGPMAVIACKRLVKDVANRLIDESLMSDTATWIAEIRTSHEAQARMKSFLEKK